jgi:hypothetical protein
MIKNMKTEIDETAAETASMDILHICFGTIRKYYAVAFPVCAYGCIVWENKRRQYDLPLVHAVG